MLEKTEEDINKEKLVKLKTAIEYFDQAICEETLNRYVLENIIDKIWIYSDKTIKFDLKPDIQALI